MPEQTLAQIKPKLKKLHFPTMTVILVTDRQGDRARSRYRVLLEAGKHVFFSEEAFGPGFGEAGAKALSELIATLKGSGVRRFKEAVLPPDVYAALDDMPHQQALERVLASAAQADPKIYAA